LSSEAGKKQRITVLNIFLTRYEVNSKIMTEDEQRRCGKNMKRFIVILNVYVYTSFLLLAVLQVSQDAKDEM